MSQTTHEHAGESYHHHWFPSFIPSSERGKLAMQRMASVQDEIEPKTHDLQCLPDEQRTPSVVLPVVLAWVSKQIRTSQALAAAYLHDNPGALDHTSSTVVRDEIIRICEEWGDMAVEFFEGELPSQYKEHSEVPEALKAIDRTAREECSMWLHAIQSALREGPQGAEPQPRTKIEVIEKAVAEHVTRDPYVPIRKLSSKLRCATGTVQKTPAWRANQDRLEEAKKQGVLPTAIPFDERYINEHGVGKNAQRHGAKEAWATIDDRIDAEERAEKFKKIGEVLKKCPDANIQKVASACDCNAGDVELYVSNLKQLTSGQAEDEKEDTEEEDRTTKRGKRQKWVPKKV